MKFLTYQRLSNVKVFKLFGLHYSNTKPTTASGYSAIMRSMQILHGETKKLHLPLMRKKSMTMSGHVLILIFNLKKETFSGYSKTDFFYLCTSKTNKILFSALNFSVCLYHDVNRGYFSARLLMRG